MVQLAFVNIVSPVKGVNPDPLCLLLNPFPPLEHAFADVANPADPNHCVQLPNVVVDVVVLVDVVVGAAVVLVVVDVVVVGADVVDVVVVVVGAAVVDVEVVVVGGSYPQLGLLTSISSNVDPQLPSA